MQDYEKVKFWIFPLEILRFQTRSKIQKIAAILEKKRWKGMKCIVYKFLLVRRLCNNYIWLADKWLQPFYIFHFFWSLFIFRGWSIFIRFVWIVRFSATTVRSTSQTRITFTKKIFKRVLNWVGIRSRYGMGLFYLWIFSEEATELPSNTRPCILFLYFLSESEADISSEK